MAGPLGTLIVVVLKARNLPNKQRIGKQDPYATCTYLSHRKRTKTDKRGGQHPVWDDELRFDIYDNPKDAMASSSVATTATGGVAPLKSHSPSVSSVTATSLKELRVAVYADDPRDPDLIGEGKVDLTETLKKGEFDDWVTVTNKGKYQGEIYLEMTFYSAKPPPEKLHTPAGPVRAGVFEASSPGSAKLPTPTQPATSQSLSKKPSPSPLATPSKSLNPDSVPLVLRAGRPISGPTPTAHLPFPGEPSTSKNATLSSRQRSNGSLSMPTANFGIENHPPSRAPSRNHSLDRSDHLIDSVNSLSLSGRTSAHNHSYLSQPKTPDPLGFPNSLSHQRPYRHSFSGHPRLQLETSIPQSHSASPPVHTVESVEDRFHEHSIPQRIDPSYPDRIPLSSQHHRAARPSLGARRPLPIPGGDSIHRPSSAWDSSQNITVGQRYGNEVAVLSQQQQPTGYSQYPDDYEHPAVPVMPNNGHPYPSQMQYADGHSSPNGVHQQPTSNRPPNISYSSQYYPTPTAHTAPFAQTQLSGHVAYNLPPPPAGQTPVPIHEVFGSSSGRPFPVANPQVVQSPSRPHSGGGSVYSYQGSHSDRFQHHNPPFQPPIDKSNSHHHLYSSQTVPPPPPSHLQQPQPQPPPPSQQQQQLKYQSFSIPPTNSGIQGSAPPEMYYHQMTYAPPPPISLESTFDSSNTQYYPEHNNPFHNPQRPDSVIPGNVYTRPSLSSNPLPPPPPNASPVAYLNHGLSHTSSSVPFYYPSGYNQPTPSYPQT